MQSCQNLIQDFQMLLVCVGVHQKVVYVSHYVRDVSEYSFHETLEAGRTA